MSQPSFNRHIKLSKFLTIRPFNSQIYSQCYLRMSKDSLVERLITAERALAEQRERWLIQQDETLTWRLRAEAAETQLQDLQAKTSRRKS
jgi:hypothetical protein